MGSPTQGEATPATTPDGLVGALPPQAASRAPQIRGTAQNGRLFTAPSLTPRRTKEGRGLNPSVPLCSSSGRGSSRDPSAIESAHPHSKSGHFLIRRAAGSTLRVAPPVRWEVTDGFHCQHRHSSCFRGIRPARYRNWDTPLRITNAVAPEPGDTGLHPCVWSDQARGAAGYHATRDPGLPRYQAIRGAPHWRQKRSCPKTPVRLSRRQPRRAARTWRPA